MSDASDLSVVAKEAALEIISAAEKALLKGLITGDQFSAMIGFIVKATETVVDGEPVLSVEVATASLIGDILSIYATKVYVNDAIAALVNAAPGVLDTLKELADAIGDDANFSTTITNLIGTKANKLIDFNRQAASYTLVLADAGKLVEMNNATANNLTVPPNSSVAFPVGTEIPISQYGAGQTTVVAGVGVTINSAGGALKLSSQYSGATLVKVGVDEWYLFGDIIT